MRMTNPEKVLLENQVVILQALNQLLYKPEAREQDLIVVMSCDRITKTLGVLHAAKVWEDG